MYQSNGPSEAETGRIYTPDDRVTVPPKHALHYIPHTLKQLKYIRLDQTNFVGFVYCKGYFL